MMKRLFMAFTCLFVLSGMATYAQEKIADGIEIDKFVHNFGDILFYSGPV